MPKTKPQARRQAPPARTTQQPRQQSRQAQPPAEDNRARGMRCVNRVVLLGALGQDAETRYTGAGTAVSTFSIATNRRWRGADEAWKEETQWSRIVVWDQENTAKYLTKGKQVYVEGRLQTRSYEKDGVTVWATEVVADTIILLGGPRESNERPAHRDGITDDDVPL